LAVSRSLIASRAVGEATLGGAAVLRKLAAISAADVTGYLPPAKAAREAALAHLTSLRHNPINLETALRRGRPLETRAIKTASVAVR
jgi:hypothetical protein